MILSVSEAEEQARLFATAGGATHALGKLLALSHIVRHRLTPDSARRCLPRRNEYTRPADCVTRTWTVVFFITARAGHDPSIYQQQPGARFRGSRRHQVLDVGVSEEIERG